MDVNSKEKCFVSVVCYLHNNGENAVLFLRKIHEQVQRHFENFELIAVDDRCTDDTVNRLREWAKDLTQPLSILHMSVYHKSEAAVNAGIDAAIGDFVYEFDDVNLSYPLELIFPAYEKALEGNDIVSVCPRRMRGISKVFYSIFNKNSPASARLRTEAFRLVTRRAINRINSVSNYLLYRKAAYASSGLKIAELEFEGSLEKHKSSPVSLSIDSLVLYTSAGYRISTFITVTMFLLGILELLYTIFFFFTGRPIEGWTTTMIAVTLGFAGLFLILTIIIKYLSLLLDIVFRKQKYLVEGIEKIQK